MAAKDGIGGPAVILKTGALKGVEAYPPAVETRLRTPVVAGVTGLVIGVTMRLPRALM